MNEEEIICMTCQDGTSDRWQCPECNRDIYEDRELRNRIAELETDKHGMLATIFNLERRLEESCAQNVADNYLVPALSQKVDDLKARNAELVEALRKIENFASQYIGNEATIKIRRMSSAAIRAGEDA